MWDFQKTLAQNEKMCHNREKRGFDFMIKPDYEFKSILDIENDFFEKEGIEYLLIDIDNTLVADNAPDADERAVSFLKSLQEKGISFYLVSNNTEERVKSFNRDLDYPYIFRARKPFSKKIRAVMKEMGAKKENTALIGDQIFTDLLASKNSGIRMILVSPINTKIENTFFKVKRFLEKLVYKRQF